MLLVASSRLLKRLKMSQYFWLYIFYGALAFYILTCLYIVVKRVTPNLIWILLNGLYESIFGESDSAAIEYGQALVQDAVIVSTGAATIAPEIYPDYVLEQEDDNTAYRDL